MLYDLVHEVYHLPTYLHRDVMKKIVTEWRRLSHFVDDVAEGRTSFEEALRPLAKEHLELNFLGYRKGRMSRGEYQKLVQVTKHQFNRILPLSHTSFYPRAGSITSAITDPPPSMVSTTFAWMIGLASLVIIITASALQSEAMLLWFMGALVLGLPISAGIILGPKGVLERRDIARMTLGRAKFLDEMFRLVK